MAASSKQSYQSSEGTEGTKGIGGTRSTEGTENPASYLTDVYGNDKEDGIGNQIQSTSDIAATSRFLSSPNIRRTSKEYEAESEGQTTISHRPCLASGLSSLSSHDDGEHYMNDDKSYPQDKPQDFVLESSVEQWQQIAAGSIGQCYLGTDPRTNNKFCVKQIPFNGSRNEVLEKARNEFEIQLRLQHPNILPLYKKTLAVHSDCCWIYLEYMEDGTLGAHLDSLHERDRLTEHEIKFYGSQLLRAIAHMHQNNIVHGDIMEKNMLLSKKKTVLKVADFGNASWHNENSQDLSDGKMYDILGFKTLLQRMLDGREPKDRLLKDWLTFSSIEGKIKSAEELRQLQENQITHQSAETESELSQIPPDTSLTEMEDTNETNNSPLTKSLQEQDKYKCYLQ